ncbi:MAG: acetate--CoA ligase family protein [Planctomycetota bacterium]
MIGASRKPNTVGWNILHNLLKHGFAGPVYPVHPAAHSIHSVPAFPTIGDVPGPVDLGVIVVPKQHVFGVARECVDAGLKGLIVITAGFKEIGGEGVERELALVELVRGAGVRMVGPNCIGVLNTDPDVSMNATFAPAMPPPGPVAFISQSGAMGVSILDHAVRLGIGISSFVSSGNKADVSGNDMLEEWRDDPRTEVILMYLEDFGNPARFVEITREITRHKPVCIVKSGRTGAGARAAASHTGALAGTELATDALIAQAGAIQVPTVAALFDMAMGFASQPLPRGPRVAIVTNAGGAGIIAADAVETNGLEVPQLSPETQQSLAAGLPDEASVKNPVDMIATAHAAEYERSLDGVLADPGIDAAIASFVPPLGVQTKDIAGAIARAAGRRQDKPVLAVLMGQAGVPTGDQELQLAGVPAYLYPESPARALAAMWRQRRIVERPAGVIPDLEADDEAIEAILDSTLAAGRAMLTEPDALRLLEACGVPTLPWSFVPLHAGGGDDAPAGLPPEARADERASFPSRCADAAEALSFPVAMKIVDPRVVHKTDVGGVQLGLASRAEVESGVSAMLDRVAAAVREGGDIPAGAGVEVVPRGFLLQRMGPEGTETIVGVTRVPRMGPMVMFGLGGIFVEVMRDVVLRLAPLRDTDAREMIGQVRLGRLLDGVRGQAARDRAAIEQTILRIAQLAVRHPRLVEMDINPLLAMPTGVVAIDARVRVGLAAHP